MSEASPDTKNRNRKIAANEAERQTRGDIRVSVWAIAIAVILGLVVVGWGLLHR